MKFYQVNNPKNTFGQYDYKGMNLDLIVSGSQEYANDGSIVILATNEEGLSHPDLVELTEAEYQTQRSNIQTANRTANPPLEDTVKSLQTENAQLKTQLAQTNSDLQGFMDLYFSVNP